MAAMGLKLKQDALVREEVPENDAAEGCGDRARRQTDGEARGEGAPARPLLLLLRWEWSGGVVLWPVGVGVGTGQPGQQDKGVK
jgi:hypothetical protein